VPKMAAWLSGSFGSSQAGGNTSRYAGETPADPPAAVQSQLTCHALRAAEFERELLEGGSHGGHMAATCLPYGKNMASCVL
jgi:hypothetical protein